MMIAFFMYGGMTMSILPREEGISFEYHLFGAIAGVLAAVLFRNADPKPVEKTYDWEQDTAAEGEDLIGDDLISDDLIGDEWQGELEVPEDPEAVKSVDHNGDFRMR